ncbi:MAG: S46 family peptidase, partial [Chitinophagaceae bacterium]|nr:S46 family peptidase [Chitinophagaceae bacterium]
MLKQSLLAFLLLAFSVAKADEGMWLPQLLAQLNEKQMKSMGMKISAADIYNINKGSLKDAIVSFGGFCTGEVISSKGLVLTNHHCGFDAIQNHSTIQNNYIRDGFWARNNAEEIPNPGLFVTFIIRIDDVTKQVLNGVTRNMDEKERQSAIDKNIAELRKNVKKENYQDSFIRAFFDGNQYFLFVTETYKDVRLVGAPPSSVGNFGKDTDNWMWPRHTGDFSMFRIYAGKDNKPAEYSVDNVPYVPKRSLSISLDGVAENDFTMVFGFPGRTTQYLHSAAVEQIMKVNDPVKIAIRDKALAVIDGFMRKDEQIKIQYAAKYAGIANSWKKWQGEVLGLTSTNALGKKQAYEAEFQKRVNANPQWKEAYGNLLLDLVKTYNEFEKYSLARDFFNETMSRIEAFAIVNQLNSLRNAKEKNGEKGFTNALPGVKERLAEIYKEYSPVVD